MARRFQERGLVPDLILVSAATRTRETAETFAKVLGVAARLLQADDALYLAEGDYISRRHSRRRAARRTSDGHRAQPRHLRRGDLARARSHHQRPAHLRHADDAGELPDLESHRPPLRARLRTRLTEEVLRLWLSRLRYIDSAGGALSLKLRASLRERKMNSRKFGKSIVQALACIAAVSVPAFADEPLPPVEALKDSFPAQKSYSPYAGRNFPTQVFFGDTHVHTGASMDAGAFGARLGTGGSLPFRARRGGHRGEWHEGQTLAAARFHRRRRSLGQYGLLPQAVCGRSQLSWPTRPASAGTR